MSLILMAQALKVKVGNPLRKLVLIKLADNANDEGKCWPSHSHIADHCEISSRSVMNHIKALEKAMFLTVKHRVKDNKKQSNMYHLHFEKALISSEGDSLPSGAGDSLPKQISSEGDSLPPAGDSLPSSAGDSHRTSHSLEPVNEPSKINKKKSSLNWSQIKLTEKQKDDISGIRLAAKAKLTQRALDAIIKEFHLAAQFGIDYDESIDIWAVRGWKAYKADWALNHKGTCNANRSNGQSTAPGLDLDSIDY